MRCLLLENEVKTVFILLCWLVAFLYIYVEKRGFQDIFYINVVLLS